MNIQNITTSEIKISCIIDKENGPKALQIVHDAFELGTRSSGYGLARGGRVIRADLLDQPCRDGSPTRCASNLLPAPAGWAFAGLLVLPLSAVLDRFGLFRYAGDDWRNFDRQTSWSSASPTATR